MEELIRNRAVQIWNILPEHIANAMQLTKQLQKQTGHVKYVLHGQTSPSYMMTTEQA